MDNARGFHISDYGYAIEGLETKKTARPFTLRVSEIAPTTNRHTTEVVDLTEEEDADTQLCPNCKQRIPKESFTPHTLFCARSLVPCRTCKALFHRNIIRSHWHCPHCPASGIHGDL